MGHLRKFCMLERREKLLFCESLVLHLIVGLMLKVIPFRRIPGMFRSRQLASGTGPGNSSPRSPVRRMADRDSRQQEVVENIRVAVERAGWVSPWRNRCLVSSLTARCMLNRRMIGSELSLGMAKDAEGKLKAHAWLKSGDFEIVEKRGSYTELFLF